ncbi:TPA: DrmB family protein [Proteus mirabilis]|uniref:DrmB family protein n=1 Tax=Proteus mirabilis TaxID=584 RepID=UPI0034E5DC19
MTDSNRSYRSSQLISPFGPGAIIDIGDESLILMDIKHWPKNLEEIKLDRLTREAGVWALKKPPVLENRWGKVNQHNSLLTYRFPVWMFCPKCRHLKRWSTESQVKLQGVPICNSHQCNKKTLVPMRFVAACNHGHLQDIPWDRWAHQHQKESCPMPTEQLYFYSNSEMGSGLDALEVHCKNCGAKNSLGNIMHEGALNITCSDKQPWEFKSRDDMNCKEPLHVLQRGASNLYYPIVRSALDIPYSAIPRGIKILEAIQQHEDDYKGLMLALGSEKEKIINLYANDLCEKTGFSSEEIITAARSGSEAKREFKIPDDKELRLAEWEVLSRRQYTENKWINFITRDVKFSNVESLGFKKYIKKIVLVDKLREVRAFCGFERIRPDDNPVLMEPKKGQCSWLPACEVFGEGIFIEFDQKALEDWEHTASKFVKPRIDSVSKRYAGITSSYLPEPTAKFVVLHTFAHLIIRQLSFESGYSSGSLRERIYAYEGQAGILVYTADGDSEGSLGGLVQQGEPKRLFPAIIAALETANWCSNDPVCSELEAQGVMGLNKAACHSCTLVSETSCENNNLLLDRKLLIGDQHELGLFSLIMKDLNEELN